jgi:hypothetical protein
MNRRACVKHGHKWVSWHPGGDAWCRRLFCKAKAKGHHSRMIDLLRAATAGGERIGTEKVYKP